MVSCGLYPMQECNPGIGRLPSEIAKSSVFGSRRMQSRKYFSNVHLLHTGVCDFVHI